jgi:hypothetical protein
MKISRGHRDTDPRHPCRRERADRSVEAGEVDRIVGSVHKRVRDGVAEFRRLVVNQPLDPSPRMRSRASSRLSSAAPLRDGTCRSPCTGPSTGNRDRGPSAPEPRWRRRVPACLPRRWRVGYSWSRSQPSTRARSPAALGDSSRGSTRAALRSAPCSKYDSSDLNCRGEASPAPTRSTVSTAKRSTSPDKSTPRIMLASSAATATAAGVSHGYPALRAGGFQRSSCAMPDRR